MNRCFFMPQNGNTHVRTLIGGLTLFYFLFMFPGLIEALQTALVRTSDGDVYQIRFRNKAPRRGGYGLDDFVRDLSIYDQSGRVKLCPSNDIELHTENGTQQLAEELGSRPLKAFALDVTNFTPDRINISVETVEE